MKNKLTLKSLKQELENMKVKNVTKSSKSKPMQGENITSKGGIGHDIKNSYINRMYMRSSGFMLYLVTGVLAYAHKIPFLGRIISLLAAYYGRTTIWKILVKARKAFVIFNALLGLLLVFKTTGFSTDNLVVGFTTIGETYIQSFFSLTKRLFYWFVELFDHKIVPNVPGDNGGTWFSRSKIHESKSLIPSSLNIPNLIENDTFSLRKLYMNSTPSSTPWYRDSSTWMWIIGGACTLGMVYLGYKLVTDPIYIISFFKSSPIINTEAPTPPIDPEITLDSRTINRSWFSSIISSAKGFGTGVSNVYKATINRLNPFNYFVSVADNSDQFNLFMEIQNDLNRANRRLYPFTTNNPFNSYFTRLRIHYFGENVSEWTTRSQRIMDAERIYNSLSISRGKMIDISGGTPIFSTNTSLHNSPSITPATVIGLNPTSSIAGPSLTNIPGLATQAKLSSISPTPSIVATTEWMNHTFDKTDEHYNQMERYRNWKLSAAYIRDNLSFSEWQERIDKVEELEKNINAIQTSENKFVSLFE